MKATHKNIKSDALVEMTGERNGVISITEGKKKRFIECERFARDYVALEAAALAVDPNSMVVNPALSPRAPEVPARTYDFGPRKMNEAAMLRQRLVVPGSRRKDLDSVDRDVLKETATVPFCVLCGCSNNLQNAHAPSGLFGKAMGLKGNGGVVARLCGANIHTNELGCHEKIDQHKVGNWRELFLEAFARTRAWLHQTRKAA